jgi:hypothetical protein
MTPRVLGRADCAQLVEIVMLVAPVTVADLTMASAVVLLPPSVVSWNSMRLLSSLDVAAVGIVPSFCLTQSVAQALDPLLPVKRLLTDISSRTFESR